MCNRQTVTTRQVIIRNGVTTQSYSYHSTSGSSSNGLTNSAFLNNNNLIGQFQGNVHPSGIILQGYPSVQPQVTTTTTTCPTKKPITKIKTDNSSTDNNTSTDKDFNEFELETLRAHNEYRSKHGVPPLQLKRSLCQFATEWANQNLAWGKMQHRQNSGYGENIFWSMGSTVNGETAVKSWYDEVKLYRYGTNQFSAKTGHFTQVIWRDSKYLGVGIAKRGNQAYVVANYDPPGNYAGQFLANVPAPVR